MKRYPLLLVSALCAMLFTASAFALVSGKKNVPGDYPSLAAAIADINASGVGTGGVIINVSGDDALSVPVAGYVITATATQTNPIVIRGNGQRFLVPSITDKDVKLDDVFRIANKAFVSVEGFDMEWAPLDVEPVRISTEAIR